VTHTIIDNQISSYIYNYLEKLTDPDSKQLLQYSINLHSTWTSVLDRLEVNYDDSVLDVGTGLGLVPIDLGSKTLAKVTGCDISPKYVSLAKDLLARIRESDMILSNDSISFDVADIESLPYDSNSFSKVIAREVFSYLQNPAKAANEIARVTKLGGKIIVEDIDDSLYITYPEPSQSFEHLLDIVRKLQSDKGGDRKVGRKLSNYLVDAGLSVTKIEVLTDSTHLNSEQIWVEKEFIARQLIAVKPDAVTRGITTIDQFDRAFNSWLTEEIRPGFRMNARVLVWAEKKIDDFQRKVFSIS
jgi:ubiquinone/menaquinone biosynthesis C-methylase UbiE